MLKIPCCQRVILAPALLLSSCIDASSTNTDEHIHEYANGTMDYANPIDSQSNTGPYLSQCYRAIDLDWDDFRVETELEDCISTPLGHGWIEVEDELSGDIIHLAIPYSLDISSCYAFFIDGDELGHPIISFDVLLCVCCESDLLLDSTAPACGPGASAIKYPNPKHTSGQLVGARGTPVSGGTIWPESTPAETAARFCRDRGLCSSTSRNTSVRSSAYSYVHDHGTGLWGTTGNSGVTMLDKITCQGSPLGEYQLYANPTVSGVRVGRLSTSTISFDETAKQFCILNGHEPAYVWWDAAYPTGTAYSWWNGSDWGVTGNSSVHLFDYISCVSL